MTKVYNSPLLALSHAFKECSEPSEFFTAFMRTLCDCYPFIYGHLRLTNLTEIYEWPEESQYDLTQYPPLELAELSLQPSVILYRDERTAIIPFSSRSRVMGYILVAANTINLEEHEMQILECAAYFSSVFLNILSEQQIDEQVQVINETRDYLSNIIENMVHGVITIDTGGIISTFSRGAELLLELSASEVVNKHYSAVFSSEIGTVVEKLHNRIKRGFSVVEGEANYNLQGQYSIPIKFTASRLKDKAGAKKGIVLVCKDSSSVKRLVALQELRKMKSEFLSIASHEFKTPLNLISGSAGILSEKMVGDLNDKQQRLVSLIKEGAQRLQQLINNLLDITRLELHKTSARQTVHIIDILNDVMLLLQHSADEKKITITKYIENKDISIAAEYEQLFKVLDNLINNAIKYTPEGGTVDITINCLSHDDLPKRYYLFTETERLEIMENAIEIIISDSGIGIAAEHIDLIFSQFHRVPDPYVQKTEGTGLGLSITKKIVESLGGSITVQSTPRQGSSFIVLLPISNLPESI